MSPEQIEQERLMLQSYLIERSRQNAELQAIQQYARTEDPEGMLRRRIYELIACTASSAIDCAAIQPALPPPNDSSAWHGENPTRTSRRMNEDLLFHRLVDAQAHLICEEVFRYQRGMADRYHGMPTPYSKASGTHAAAGKEFTEDK